MATVRDDLRTKHDVTKEWNNLKSVNKVHQVQPLGLETPIFPDKVRFVCVSDTHSTTNVMSYPVPLGDVFIHAGDFSRRGAIEEVVAFNTFLGGLPHPYKIVIAGNHELSFDEVTAGNHHLSDENAQPEIVKAELKNCTYLEDAGIEVYGLNIYGSPWQPRFYDWAFNLTRGKDCMDKWDLIPDNTDVLVTHGPPIGYGDLCMSGAMAGCEDLLRTIRDRVKPKFHIFGHIHEGYGITTNGTTTFINASTCNRNYEPINPPIIFDLPLPNGMTKY